MPESVEERGDLQPKPPEVVDHALLATVAMWVGKVSSKEAIRLTEVYYKFEEVYEANVILSEKMGLSKPTKPSMRGANSDQLGRASSDLVKNLADLSQQASPKVLPVVGPSSLALVPMVENTYQPRDDIALGARVLNLEKVIGDLSKAIMDMKNTPPPSTPVPATYAGAAAAATSTEATAGVRPGAAIGAIRKNWPNGLGVRDRGRSPSVKRKPESQEIREPETVVEQDPPFTEVQRRRPRKVQYGKSSVTVTGGEAAPYEVFIGNTNPASTKAIIEEVLKECANSMPVGMELDEEFRILDIECLTKSRDDGYPIRTKSWKVKVPHKFRDHMMRPEAYPLGWSSRRYFPPRAPRPAVPPLNPLDKRAHLGLGPHPDVQSAEHPH